jgi:hypothetical protein
MIRTSHKLITTESRGKSRSSTVKCHVELLSPAVGYLAASPAVPLHDPNTPISRPDEDSLSQQSVYDAFVMVWQSLKTATQLASNIYERVQVLYPGPASGGFHLIYETPLVDCRASSKTAKPSNSSAFKSLWFSLPSVTSWKGHSLSPNGYRRCTSKSAVLLGTLSNTSWIVIILISSSVLKDIQTAVDKCIPSSSQSTRKHNKVVGLLRSQAAERKRTLATQADVEELRRKLRHVADEFWVRI